MTSNPKTRRAILTALKQNGPMTAQQLCKDFGVTAMAVRQHLYTLQDQKLVLANARPGGRGRPRKYWQLSQDAQSLFPDMHQDLAVEVLSHVRSAFGETGLQKVVDRHAKSQLRNYRNQLTNSKSMQEKLAKLAQIRTEEGYMAEVQRDASDWLFIENHCPVCTAATACTRLCDNELSVFQSLLGPNAIISREEHIINGPRRCLYRIKTD